MPIRLNEDPPMECPLVARDLAQTVTSVYEVRYKVDHFDNQHTTTTTDVHKLAANLTHTVQTVQSPLSEAALSQVSRTLAHRQGLGDNTQTNLP